MTQTETKNKLLPIFYNYKETADALPKKHRGEFWELVINYAFDGENAIKDDLEHCNRYVKIAFFSIKNLLKLNKKAGSQNGKSNNPSGLSKTEEPNIGANIGANITPIPYIKENKIKQNNKNEELNKIIDDIKDDVVRACIKEWIQYKKEKKDSYTPSGLKKCISRLQKLSGGDPTLAQEIVDSSMANGYAGLFLPKGVTQNKETVWEHNMRLMKEMEEENANESLFW